MDRKKENFNKINKALVGCWTTSNGLIMSNWSPQRRITGKTEKYI